MVRGALFLRWPPLFGQQYLLSCKDKLPVDGNEDRLKKEFLIVPG
jgi:hypothetical protein